MVTKPSPALTLSETDTLKLTFHIMEKDGDKGVQPHQTFLRFYDEVSGEEGIQPVRVTSGGKAKFELVRNPLADSEQYYTMSTHRTWLAPLHPFRRPRLHL
jgi:oligosaccharyltransferase complex subunit delta (ribophorin II)